MSQHKPRLIKENPKNTRSPEPVTEEEILHDNNQDRLNKIAVSAASADPNHLTPGNILQLQRTMGNQAVQRMLEERSRAETSPAQKISARTKTALPAIQRDDNVIEVDIVEGQQEPTPHPGDISEIVTDTLRTARACLGNFHTALQNFETRISNESGREAAPKDPALIALEQVGSFVFGQLTSQITSAVPGGSFINSLVGLGQGIDQAIQAERRRSADATDRNAAANFIIRIRSQINTVNGTLLTNMTENVIAARQEHDAAQTDEERGRIRRRQETANRILTQRFSGNLSESAIFTRIVEAWINETTTDNGRPAKVIINLDRAWNVREAHLDAPFGSRLAEQLEQQGPLDVRNLDVPRLVQWFPHYGEEGGGLVRCMADVNVAGQATNARAMGIQSTRYFQEFMRLLSTRPIPESTRVTGRRVG